MVVTGSAGAGKSTLLTSWANALAARGEGVGWLGLRPDDNDPANLVTALASAARAALEGLVRFIGDTENAADDAADDDDANQEGESRRRPPAPHLGPALDASGAALQSWVEAALCNPGYNLWLVLDDVHLVRDARSLQALTRLLESAPPNLNVVLSARADPALHLARLRVQGRLREVRDHDLRLTLAETGALVGLHDLHLDRPQIDLLHTLTEGWAAGVGLAALSLSSGRDPDSFLSAFARDDGAVAAYLVDEVLDALDDDRREFMLDTCVPDELDEPLAVRLSNRDDAGVVLAHLTATNSLMTVGRDQDPVTYRYHILLRSYLRARLRASSVKRNQMQHAQTAVWFCEQGRASDALDHAVASADPVLLRAVLHRYGVGLLLEGHPSRVEQSVARVPQAAAVDPALLALAAVASLQSGHLAAARSHLAAATGALAETTAIAETLAATPATPTLTESATALETTRSRASIPYVPLPTDRLIGIATWGTSQFEIPNGDRSAAMPATRTYPSNAAAPNLVDLDLLEQLRQALALVISGQPGEGRVLFERALQQARRSGRAFAVLSCLTGLTVASAAAGQRAQMRRWADEAIAHATRAGLGQSIDLLLPHALAAEGALEHHDIERAEQQVSAALAIVGHTTAQNPNGSAGRSEQRDVASTVMRTLRATMACVEFARAEAAPVRQREIVTSRLEEVRRLPPAVGAINVTTYELITLHRMALVTAQLSVAEAVEAQSAAIPPLVGDLHVMRGLHSLRLGHEREARSHVAPVVRGELGCVMGQSEVTAQLIEVTVARRNQQATVAHEALLRALDVTASQDGLRMMLGVSADVMTALRAARGRFGRHESVVDRLIEIDDAHQAHGEHGDHDGPGRPRPATGPGAAPLLSPRELSLLHDLPSMLTVSEIALARSVSPNTVKTQLRSLFEKLGVSTRRDAVAVGRREGLI